MRVTPGMTADNALFNLQQGRSKLDRIQEQIASGVMVSKPSDDPISTRQILDLENKIKEGEQYASNIKKGNLWLNITDTALKGIADIIAQTKTVAGTITSGSSDPTVRANTVSQLTELKKQLIDLGNTQLGDQYIFAGFKNNTAPFSQSNNNFNGTSDMINAEIDKGSTAAINVSGDALLRGTGSYGSVNILQTLDDLTAAITANNVSNIQTAASALDTAANQITNAQSDVAGRMIRFDSAEKMINRNQNTLKSIISDMQDVDYAKAATELNQQKLAFEAALAATAKITQLSLLDYLK